MKSIDLFCASQASTAICSSTDQRAMVRHGTRPIDRRRHRHRHIIEKNMSDLKNLKNTPLIPCSSDQPINPTTYYYQKSSKNASFSSSSARAFVPRNSSEQPMNPKPYYQNSRKSASASTSTYKQLMVSDQEVAIRRKSTTDIISDLTTTTNGNSSRYLLSDDKHFLDILPEMQTDHLSALVVDKPMMPRSLSSNDESLVISNQSNSKLVAKSSSARSWSRYEVFSLFFFT